MSIDSGEDRQVIRVVRAPGAPPIENVISRQLVARDGAVALVEAGIVDDERARVVYTQEKGASTPNGGVNEPAIIALSVQQGYLKTVVDALGAHNLALEKSDSAALMR